MGTRVHTCKAVQHDMTESTKDGATHKCLLVRRHAHESRAIGGVPYAIHEVTVLLRVRR